MNYLGLVMGICSTILMCMDKPVLKKCKHEETRKESIDEEIKKIKNKEVAYIPINDLTPGQLRYSAKNTQIKLSKLKKINKTYNNGTSLLDEKNALPVILGPGNQIVVLDGHHEIMAHIKDFKTHVPVKMNIGFSYNNPNNFWNIIEKDELIYNIDLQGNKQSLDGIGWHNLQNDPLRYFMAITCLRLQDKQTPYDQAECRAANGNYVYKHPLWIKLENAKDETPFIDLKIADVLRRHTFSYDEQIYDNDPTQQDVEVARKILLSSEIGQLKGFIMNSYAGELTQKKLNKLLQGKIEEH